MAVVETPWTRQAPTNKNAGFDDAEAGDDEEEVSNTFEEPANEEDFQLAETAPRQPHNLAEGLRAIFMAIDTHVLRVVFWDGYGSS